jgi:FkbM family methyltransferase
MQIDVQKLEHLTASLPIKFLDDQIRQSVVVADCQPIYFSSAVEERSENLPGGGCGENMRAAYSHPDKPYEPLITAFFYLVREQIPALQMVDVGALWGHTSLVAATIFGKSNIHLFEMNPITTEVLKKNMKLNEHLKAEFDVQNVVLSDTDVTTKVTFRHYTARYGKGKGGSNLSRLKIFRENFKSWLKRMFQHEGRGDYITTQMQIRSLDHYCLEKGFIPNLIKIDVEGSQHAVLMGAREVLNQHRPLVLVEFDTPDSANNIGKSNRDVLQLMQSMGYRCIWGDHRSRKTNLHQIDANSEINIEINSLAIFY